MRVIFLACLLGSVLLASGQPSAAGRISAANLKRLRLLDDSLQTYGNRLLDDTLVTDRLRADSMFTRLLVRSLTIPYSFYFQYDSMQMAPTLYAPDSSFRIITWHLPMNDDNFRQRGVIQMNTPDGSPKLFPLFDASDYTEHPQDSVRDASNWIGAVYYGIVQHEAAGQQVYTLLGYDENNDRTTRKWIDILRFDIEGKPIFGGDFFAIPDDSIFPRTAKRFLLEYKKEGRARIRYDHEDSLIVIDHLVSETGEPDKKYTLVPGGDYQALKWSNGRWHYIDKLYTEARGDGNEPRDVPILDDAGNFDEAALDKQTKKNLKAAEEKERKAGKPPAKPAAPAKKKPAKTNNG